ncbi:MAG: glycine zipper domain-containing protein [Phycisphaerales bacterium]
MNRWNTNRSRLAAAGLVGLTLVASGCSNAGEGALSGAAVGALGGLAIGSLTGSAGAGAAIGAVSGAVAGGVIGDQNERRRDQSYR